MGTQDGNKSPVASSTSVLVRGHNEQGLSQVDRSCAPPSRASRVLGAAVVGLQLLLILFVVHIFEVGSRLHFFPVLCAAVVGFLVQCCLPRRFRLSFFCLLSLAVVNLVLGFPNGLIVIGIGYGLIAVCYLPIPFPWRVTIIVLCALALAFLRLDLSRSFWAVLGSMFMFRMIVFLFELKRATTCPPLTITTAYFFPLQNVCFLFFPILDFKTFRETHRAQVGWHDAQGGVVFLVRGLSHLLVYRIIKYYVLPSPHQLGDLPNLTLFMASNYALYLHVSGYFHIITGIFHLFGFGVPRTHHNYFLATSFTDIWRRINIPWKEFMAKVFFFPVFFAARGLGTRAAIIVAALWVFVVTWVLHSYQVFWLTGSIPLRVYDASLWIIVGILVAWNLQRDLRLAREPRPAHDRSFIGAVFLAARVVGMFVLVSFFWACWSTPGFLLFIRTQITNPHWLAGGWQVIVVLMGLVLVGTAAKLMHDRLTRQGVLPLRVSDASTAIFHLVILTAVLVISLPQVAEKLGPDFSRKIGEISRESVTPVEAAKTVQGYYEEIVETPVRAGALLAGLEGAPRNQTHYSDLTRSADDYLEHELIPNWKGELAGAPISINRYGMRDRPNVTLEKPAGVRRIAVVGSSIVMGYGVRDDEPFPRLVEDRLNTQKKHTDPRVELLNFGTGKSFAIHRRALLDQKVFKFHPDVIYIVGHQDEYLGIIPHLVKLIGKGDALRYPALEQILNKAGVTASTPAGEAQARLQPYATEIALAIYRGLVAECKRRGILAVWIYIPMPGVAEPGGLKGEIMRMAEQAGFVVVDLSGWEDGKRPSEVMLSSADHHPNSLGQRLISDKLVDAIIRQPELIGEVRP